MPKPKVVNLDHYRETGEAVGLDNVYEEPQVAVFDIESPETHMPLGQGLNEPLPEHIRARREELKQKKIEKNKNRAVGKALLGGTAIVAAGLALMGHNSKSPEESPKSVPVHIQAGDGSITGAIRRFYQETHPGEPIDEGYVVTQAELVKDRELNGSSLVHEGDVIYIRPAE